MTTKIVVSHGDGIGPEIMAATLKILKAAGAKIETETIEIGEKVYKTGISSGISEADWNKIMKHKILLKAPITTPQGKGYKSLNVTIRKGLGLFANVRPVISYAPVIAGKVEKMDMVIIRENEEDLYSGVEYRVTENTALSYKIITKQGSEKIIRYAFEYARINKRKKVTCMSKDNIMKIADGIFHQTFDEIAKEYPDIATDHYIIDIGAARIAARPQDFDVIVTLNLYGDIISDIAAEVSGSVGIAGSSNIGQDYAMFEAIHGSAPDIAGKNMANPSGLLNGACMMLDHIGQADVACKIRNAWLRTLEDGIHTGDIYNSASSKKKVGTDEFTEALIANLGKAPLSLPKAVLGKAEKISIPAPAISKDKSELVGVDVYIRSAGAIKNATKAVEDVAEKASVASKGLALQLKLVTQKGAKVWPNNNSAPIQADGLGLRYLVKDGKTTIDEILSLIKALDKAGIEICSMQNLYNYNGVLGYTKAQGE
jgi:isocitrate dehydrogenase